jgi:hypothetical protein
MAITDVAMLSRMRSNMTYALEVTRWPTEHQDDLARLLKPSKDLLAYILEEPCLDSFNTALALLKTSARYPDKVVPSADGGIGLIWWQYLPDSVEVDCDNDGLIYGGSSGEELTLAQATEYIHKGLAPGYEFDLKPVLATMGWRKRRESRARTKGRVQHYTQGPVHLYVNTSRGKPHLSLSCDYISFGSFTCDEEPGDLQAYLQMNLKRVFEAEKARYASQLNPLQHSPRASEKASPIFED